MKLAEHSRNKLLNTFVQWSVPKDYADPIMNYLVHGFAPGSFFTAVLANDFCGAVQHSHPANSMQALKALVGWIKECMPNEAHGSYRKVQDWLKLDVNTRRNILVEHRLVYTVEDEVMLVLQGERTVEPFFYD